MFNVYDDFDEVKFIQEFSPFRSLDKNFLYRQIKEAKEELENYTGKQTNTNGKELVDLANERLYKNYKVELNMAGINKILSEIKKYDAEEAFKSVLLDKRSKNYIPWITVKYVPFRTKFNLNKDEIETICEDKNYYSNLTVSILGIDKFNSSIGKSIKSYNDKFISFGQSVFNTKYYLNKVDLLYTDREDIDTFINNFYNLADFLKNSDLNGNAYKKLYNFSLDLLDESIMSYKRESKEARWAFDNLVHFYEGMMWKLKYKNKK